jgi:CheY-like chemotaxis protein
MAKILLVEDNEMNRDMLRRRLQKRGHEVVVAENGQDGIESARSELPAIILMDLSLPDVDGWEATRRLKAAPETRHIPILALTAHAMPWDAQRARDAGCDAFGTKPLDFEWLLAEIDGLLVGRR